MKTMEEEQTQGGSEALPAPCSSPNIPCIEAVTGSLQECNQVTEWMDGWKDD